MHLNPPVFNLILISRPLRAIDFPSHIQTPMSTETDIQPKTVFYEYEWFYSINAHNGLN